MGKRGEEMLRIGKREEEKVREGKRIVRVMNRVDRKRMWGQMLTEMFRIHQRNLDLLLPILPDLHVLRIRTEARVDSCFQLFF